MKKHTYKTLLPFVLFLFYLILDYINLPSLIGFIPQNINLELLGIVFDAAIVITLYIVSFYYIENRQAEKDENARDTASVLLEKTYCECLDNLEFLDNKLIVEKYVIPKIDGNKTDSENKIVHNLQTLPFASFDTIMSLATSGYIPKKVVSDYMEIKKEYQYLVSVKITFFDLTNPETQEQRALYKDINDRDDKLKNKLKSLCN